MSAAQKIESKSKLKKTYGVDVSALREDVTRLIAASEFTQAVQLLKQFSERDFAFPNFKLKAERYLNQSIDLVLAMESNRKFSGSASLTRSKQQELNDKFKKHHDELKEMLNKVELCYNDLLFKDNLSSRYIVKSFWASILIVSISLFILDLFNGLSQTVLVFLESGLDFFTATLSRYF